MPQRISIPEVASSKFRVSLDGTQYQIKLKWMDRTEAWYITVSSDLGIIVNEMKIVPNVALLRRNRSIAPPGQLAADTQTGSTDKITRNNFGLDKDWELVYYSEEELAEL